MKKILKSLAALTIVAISMSLTSCSGGGSSTKSILFGTLPGIMQEYEAKKDKLEEKAKDVKTEEDKAKLIKEKEELQKKWTPKIEEAAKALEGSPIDVTNGDFTVTSPITLSMKGINSYSVPYFEVSGEVKAAKDIEGSTQSMYQLTVYIAGYDDAGNALFKNKIGYIKAEEDPNRKYMPLVLKDTPVTLTQINYIVSDSKAYEEANVLKIVLE